MCGASVVRVGGTWVMTRLMSIRACGVPALPACFCLKRIIFQSSVVH